MRSGLLEGELDLWDTRLCYLIDWNRSVGSGGKWCTRWTVGRSGQVTHACALPYMCSCLVWAPMPCIRSRGRTSQPSYFGRRERQRRMHPSQLVLALSSTRPCASAAHASAYAYGRHDREENGHRRKERPRTTGQYNASAPASNASPHVVRGLLFWPATGCAGLRVPSLH